MKKTIAAISSLLILVSMTGCTNATAKLNDSSTVLLTVGSKNITKGSVYSIMSSSAGADTAITNAVKEITDAEIETTDDMQTQAETQVSYYKSMYGDSFETILEQYDITEEELLSETLESIKEDELPTKYVNDNFDSLVETYHPVKATLLSFSSEDDANSALSELKDGKDAAAAAEAYNSTSDGTSSVYTTESSLNSAVWTIVSSASPDDGWAKVPDTDNSTYYLIHVDETDANNMKDDVVTALTGISSITSDAKIYYFKKYNFHVYDINLYNSIGNSSDYSSYLVQPAVDTTVTN